MARTREDWRQTQHWRSIDQRREDRAQQDRDRRAERMAEYMADEASD